LKKIIYAIIIVYAIKRSAVKSIKKGKDVNLVLKDNFKGNNKILNYFFLS